MVRFGLMAQAGMTDDPLRLMAHRYMAARQLRLSSMHEDKQEEVVDAMREAVCELRTYFLKHDKICPDQISRILDDY